MPSQLLTRTYVNSPDFSGLWRGPELHISSLKSSPCWLLGILSLLDGGSCNIIRHAFTHTHTLLGSFSGEPSPVQMSTPSICQYFSCSVCLIIELQEFFLHILVIWPLRHIWFVNIFSVCGLQDFTFMIAYFENWSFFKFNEAQLTIFYL